jgi:aminobenzoyl-glutamate utilization protein B
MTKHSRKAIERTDRDVIAIVRDRWADIRPEIERHFGLLWQEPELPNMEIAAARLLSDWLAGRGFSVERRAYGLPTAFFARKGNGQGPRIALLAEYDALPGTDNDAVPYRKRRGRRAGHACGHNQIGPANAGAAIAAAAALEQLGIAGEIIVIGCPSEEIVWGKIALLKQGAFDGLDGILTSHGDYQNGAISRPCQSVVGGEIVFSGESGHGGGVRRKNALDAAELAVQSFERLRAHHFPDTSVEHVLRVGGHIPNVTPDQSRLWITTRHVDYGRAREIYDFIIGVAEQAARMTDVAFRHQFIASTRGYLPNDTLARVLYSSLESVGPPKWTDEGKTWMRQLSEACRPGAPFTLDDRLGLYTEGHDPYGQDDGEVSWRIPLGRVNWAFPETVPLHNWALTALAGFDGSYPGPLMASEALALAAVELVRCPEHLDAAKAELAKRTRGLKLDPPNIGAWRTMTENPESFWNANWDE